MNLEELQIKVSIELKDLEKQLKSITKSIDKTLGPKTTKKLMQDNHRVIKNESIAINKTLNKAFEVDYKKFNTNLNSAMNQAKLTVRSACNDIRRELNNALNVKANIRVTGKTSINGSVTGSSSGSTTASSMASSQYIGAMIIKATNAILKNNNANTSRLENSLNKSTKEIVSAIKNIKIDSKPTHINSGNNKDVVKAINTSTRDIVSAINNINTQDKKTNQKSTTAKKRTAAQREEQKQLTNSRDGQKALTTSGINFDLKEAGRQISLITKEMQDAVKVINILKRNFSNLSNSLNTKMLGTGSYGNNLPQTEHINFTLGKEGELFIGTIERMKQAFRELKLLTTSGINFDLGDTKEQLVNILELMKEIRNLRKALTFDNSKGFTMGDSTSEYHTGKVVNSKKLGSTKALEEGKPIEVSFKVIDDDIKAQVDEAISRIKQVKLPMSAFDFDTDEITAKIKETNEHIKKPFTGSTDNVFTGAINGKSQKEVADDISNQVKTIKQAASGAFDSNGIIGLMADLFTDLGETIVKDLGNSIESPVDNHMQKIKEQINKQLENAAKNLGKDLGGESEEEPIDIDEEVHDTAVDAFSKQVKAIKEAWAKASDPEQLEKDLENIVDTIKIATSIANPINTFFEDLGAIIVRELANSIKSPEFENMQKIKDQMENGPKDLKTKPKEEPIKIPIKDASKLNEITKQIKGRMADLTNVSSNLNTPGSYVTAKGNELIGRTGKLQSGLHMEDAESKLKKIQEQIKQISDEFDTAISEISSLDVRVLEEGLSSLKDWVPTLQEAFNKLNQIDDERLKINLDTTEAQQNIETLKASLDMLIEACETNNLNAVRNLFGNEKQTQKSKPEPPKPKRTSDGLDDYASKVEKLSARLDDAADDLMEVTRILGSIDDAMSDNGISDLEQCEEVLRKLSQTDLSHLNRDIKKLAESFSGGDFDTSDIDKLVNRLKALKEIRDRLNSINKNAQKGKGIDSEAVDTQFRALKDYKNVSFGEGDDDSLGFLPYKQQLDKIVEYAKKAGAKIKEALFGFFKKEKPLENNFDLSTSRDNNFTSKEETSAFQEKELQRWINAQRAAEEQIRAFQEQTRRRWYDILIERSKAEQKLLNQTFSGSLKKPDGDDDELAITIDTSSANKLIEKAKEIGKKIKEALFNSDSQVLGFAPYQNELHELGELAKKIGAKIKNELSNAFNKVGSKAKSSLAEIRANAKDYNKVSQIQNADGSTSHSFSKAFKTYAKDYYGATDDVIKVVDKLEDAYKKASNRIKKIMKNMGQSIADAPKKGLNKLVSTAKTIWSKITGIFKKGASDSIKATDKLKTGLGDLLKQALGFFSLYSVINLGKEAIQQSQELAQAEVKLASLMKQRMGATNDTVLAIRQLAEEQAKLGVVSETAMKNGAQQLSMYVHSAKALETLMPAIANLTAKRGGVFATPEDAEEVATQLGEAIREGTTTPLEQSGIYLSEAEIEKFKALTTEEARAAYLADVIAKNVGNINEALANTPHGAIAQLKNNFQSLLGTLGIFLANVLKPIVQWLNVIVVACNNALKALGKLLGFDMTGGATSIGDVGSGGGSGGSTPVDTTTPSTPDIDTGGIDDAKDAYEDAKDAADEATEANEKFKGSLMGFDEINILTDNTSKNSDYKYNPDSGSDPSDEYDPTDITPGVGGQLPAVGELTEGENIFGEFSDKMKAFIDEVLEPFKAAWDLLGDRWKAAWADLKDSFKNFCDSLANFLKSVWENGGKEFVQHMAEIALAVGIAAMEIGGTILDALAKLWDHLDPEKNMHTQRLLDVLNEVAVKLRDFILGLNEHLENLLEYGGQDVLNAMGDCFMDLAAAAVNAFGVVIDAVDGLIDHLDPKFNVDTRNMLQATADMFHAVGTAAWDFSELLKSALANGGQDMINAFGTCVVNLGETAARVITTMMESFSKFFDYIDPAKNEITKNMMKAWEDAFYAIGDAALQFAELFESIMGNGGQEVLNKLGDAFNSLVGLVGTVVKEIADALNGLFEHLNPKTNEFTKNMLKAWQDAFDGISEMCQKIGEVLGSVMDNGGQDLLNSIGDLAMQVLETFGNMVDEVADCIGSLFEHLDPGKNKVAKGAIDAFKYFVDSIRNFVEMLGNALGTFMDNGGQEFINNVGDIVALLLDLGATIGGDIINAITAFFDSWAGHMVISACATALEIISEVLEGLLRILEPLSPVISAVVTAIGTFMVAQKVVGFIQGIVTAFQALSGAGGALALAKAGFTALWGIIAANPVAAVIAAIAAVGVALVALYNKCEGFREFADKVLEGFKGAFDKIKEHCSKLLEDIREIFGNVIDIITGIFEGDGEKVGEAVRNLIINILELIHNMNQAFVEIGWELIKGLVKGIWECIKAIPDLLMGIGEFIVDFFKGLFGIHSPSTVFAELGVNLIEGLIEGITSMASAVWDAITVIVDSILEAFSGITEKLSEVWNSIKESVSEAWNTIKDAIVEKCTETYDNVKEKYESIKETVSTKLDELKENASDAWTKIKEVTSDLVSKMKDEAEDKYNKLKDKLTDTMEDWRQKSEDKWNKVKEKTTDIVSKLKDDAEDKYNKLKEKLTDTMENWRKNSEDKWNNIKEKTASLVDTLKKDAEDKYNKLKEALTTTMDNWKKNSEEKWNEIKEKTSDLVENLKTTVEDKYNKFKEKLTSTLENLRSTSQEKWTNIKDKTTELAENLKTSVEDKYNKLKTNLASKMSDIKSDMETKWSNIKEKATSLVENLRSTVESKFNTLKTNLASKMSEIKSNIETKWGEIKTNAINKASEVVTNVTTKYNELKTNVTNKMAEVKSNAKTKWEELKTDAKSGAEGMVKKAGEGLSGLSKTLTDAIDKAKTAASNAWDKLKNVFSGSSFNFPKLPQIKIEWETITGNNWFPDVKFPKLSWNARGGIIDGITPLGFAGGALQMGGEQGKELIVPLENTSFTSKIAQAMGQAVDNALAKQSNPYNNNNNTMNDNRDIILKVNEREFARASINSINKLQRESNRTLLDI